MIYLVSTAQRCGSTWLVRMLREAAESRAVYVNGLAMGFGLTGKNREMGAVGRLVDSFRKQSGIRVFKTHDVPSADFDEVCSAMPQLRILTMHRDFRDTVVSRYFYQRYYWQSDSRLGPLPAKFTNFLSGIGEMPDHDALEALLETAIVQDWAREWRAFEDRFTTPHAVRVSYAGMLDESEYPRLVAFTELPMRKLKAFAEEQSKETRETGREGKTRFNRRGLVGEWREWWTEEQGARLSFLADGL